jgi:glutaredoxin
MEDHMKRTKLNYHLAGYSYQCPYKPRGADMFGTNDAVTDFPEMVNCPFCKKTLKLLDAAGKIELNNEGRVVAVRTWDHDGKENPQYASFLLLEKKGPGYEPT